MVRHMLLATIYIVISALLKTNLVQSQWYNAPPPSYPHIISNKPTISYQGYEEANALRQAHPNQPIIIINNGGNDGGNDKKDGFGGFGELAAIFLAARAGKRRGGGGGGEGRGPAGPEEPPLAAPVAAPAAYPTIAAPAAYPPIAAPAAYPPIAHPSITSSPLSPTFQPTASTQKVAPYPLDSTECCGGNNKSVINITIVLPSSSGPIKVEENNSKSQSRGNVKKIITIDEDEEVKEDSDEDSVATNKQS